jgi:hypothetical protein
VVDYNYLVGAWIGFASAPGRFSARLAASSRAQMITLTGCCWDLFLKVCGKSQSLKKDIIKQLDKTNQTEKGKPDFAPRKIRGSSSNYS